MNWWLWNNSPWLLFLPSPVQSTRRKTSELGGGTQVSEILLTMPLPAWLALHKFFWNIWGAVSEWERLTFQGGPGRSDVCSAGEGRGSVPVPQQQWILESCLRSVPSTESGNFGSLVWSIHCHFLCFLKCWWWSECMSFSRKLIAFVTLLWGQKGIIHVQGLVDPSVNHVHFYRRHSCLCLGINSPDYPILVATLIYFFIKNFQEEISSWERSRKSSCT